MWGGGGGGGKRANISNVFRITTDSAPSVSVHRLDKAISTLFKQIFAKMYFRTFYDRGSAKLSFQQNSPIKIKFF